MKHPTDEEIEIEANHSVMQLKMDPQGEPDYNYGYERGFISGFIKSAKWARDQQPKLKTLEEWGWAEELGNPKNIFVSVTRIGKWKVYKDSWGDWFYKSENWNFSKPCTDYECGKQLAQADYEKRVNELYL